MILYQKKKSKIDKCNQLFVELDKFFVESSLNFKQLHLYKCDLNPQTLKSLITSSAEFSSLSTCHHSYQENTGSIVLF